MIVSPVLITQLSSGDKFRLVSWHSRVLQVWRVESNQVVMAARLRSIDTNQELCVVTTHLKVILVIMIIIITILIMIINIIIIKMVISITIIIIMTIIISGQAGGAAEHAEGGAGC